VRYFVAQVSFNMSNHRWASILVIVGGICILTRQSAAQQTPTPGVIQINVNLVQVDAVVTDAKGNPVADLTAADFELLQDGERQKITNFEYVNLRDPAASLARFSVQTRAGPTMPPASGTIRRPEQVRRTIALVIDDLALSFDSLVRLRQSLKTWVDHEMRPGDLVAVVRTNAGIGALQQFTNDKRQLYAAIDLIRYQPGRVGVSSFTPAAGAPIAGGADTSVFDDAVQHSYVTASMNAIQYVVRGLRNLPGRKSVILFSENMKLTFLGGPSFVKTTGTTQATSDDRLRKLADEANRSSVVIHAIDPRGVTFMGLTAADNLNGVDTAPLIATRWEQYVGSQDGLAVLTQKTGGLFVHDTGDITAAVGRVIEDGNGYYLIGYQPGDETFDAKTKAPKFHSISLRVKRDGLTVRSRTGFFGTPDSNRTIPAPQTRQAQIANAIVSPFTTGDLNVRLTTLFSNDSSRSYIKALLNFPVDGLTFTEGPDGSRTAEIDIAAVAFDGDGEPAEMVDKTWKIHYSRQGFEEASRKGLTYSAPVAVKKPGPYQLRVVLRDSASQRIGSAAQFIEIPDIQSGRLALSGIVMAASPAARGAGSPESPARGRENPNGAASVRIFQQGTAVAYAYEIFNARADGSDKAKLETQIRLFRDGEQVYTSPPSPLTPQGDPKAKRLAVGGQIQLTNVPAGSYVMQVVVSDTLRKDKYGTTTQTMDFEVRQ
jgi:VWFA-related protein